MKHFITKALISLSLLFIAAFFLNFLSVSAQETEEEFTQKYGITFPIQELGSCANLDACQRYCDDISNFAACLDFAENKELPTESVSEEFLRILLAARQELGCQTITSCENFCTDIQNFEKCYSFALKHALTVPETTYESQEEVEILEEAREELDCDSEDSCWAFCEREENFKICEEFAQNIEDIEFEVEETAYEPIEVWCPKSNPSWECKVEDDTCVCTEPGELWCPQAGSDCKWAGQECICGPQQYEEEPPEVWCPKAGEYCKWTGDYCDCSEPGEVWCPQQPGCSWSGSECACQGDITTEITDTIPESSEFSPETIEEKPPEVWCAEYGEECKWTGEYCDCSIESTSQPELEVQGVSTGLFEMLWGYMIKIFGAN